MAETEAPKKDRFVNRSGGFLGVVVRAPGAIRGFKGISLYPGQEIDLDEEEQAETANAPRDPRANPLVNGQLDCVAEGMDFKGRRPLRPDGAEQHADPTDPRTWSEEQKSHVERIPQQEADAERIRVQMETGMDIDPSKQPAVGEYNPFEEFGDAGVEQAEPVGGKAVDGSVQRPDGGEPSPPTPPDSLTAQEPAGQPGVVTEILSPADRVGHVPGAGTRAPQPVPGQLPGHDRGGPSPRPVTPTTATP